MMGSLGRLGARWGMAVAGVAFAVAAAHAQDTRPTLAVMTFSNGAIGTANTELAPLTTVTPRLRARVLSSPMPPT